jgi:hypothetical protein
MADLNASDGAAQNSSNENGVLANLPRTRPQRSTPRRAAARSSGAARAARATRDATSSSARKRARGQATRERTRAGAPLAPAKASNSKRAPVQGYESQCESASGSVQPPGTVELLASAAELVGELTKSGFSRGERLIKDIASRLPLS